MRICPRSPKWFLHLCAVGIKHQRVNCGVPVHNGPRSFILLDGGGIAIGDLMSLGLSVAIVSQYYWYIL